MYGAVATTAIVGAYAIQKKLIDKTGLVSSLPEFSTITKIVGEGFEFGGHEVRMLPSLYDACKEHIEINEHYHPLILEQLKPMLKDKHAKQGTALNCGQGLNDIGQIEGLENKGKTLGEIVDTLRSDMASFADDDTVVINIASTEPLPSPSQAHDSLDRFEDAIENNDTSGITASMLYAYAALKAGIPFANFTPSAAASIPALIQLAHENNVPVAGNDGKTGETLVKTTLAPMFAMRNLKILGWAGFNILGDYDGMVLAHEENKASKIKTKDPVISNIVGYKPHTITKIDYFPSLKDNKTALNFIHFKGFLGTKMKFYFIWDGIDAIVAAPLILDICRFLLFAKKRGVKGVVPEMAFFFKNPMGTNVMETTAQFNMLKNWFSVLTDS